MEGQVGIQRKGETGGIPKRKMKAQPEDENKDQGK